jgi:hypothetical protein
MLNKRKKEILRNMVGDEKRRLEESDSTMEMDDSDLRFEFMT